MTSRADFPLVHPNRVRFVEVDRQGILHNSHYLAYFGIALNEYYRKLGYDRVRKGAEQGTGLHVVSASVQYRAPLMFDEMVDLCAGISRIGRTSLTFQYAIFKQDREEPAATGEQIWVHTHQAMHKPVPWPEDFVSMVEAFERKPVER
ncbi:MAG TPA: thioesterase family protein [Sphingomonadaceae bacterium]|nr:thioesterase family protein [Sphingomonadaceae bacterium]